MLPFRNQGLQGDIGLSDEGCFFVVQVTHHVQNLTGVSFELPPVHNTFHDIFVTFQKSQANFAVPFENIPDFPGALCSPYLIADAEGQIRRVSKVV